MEDESILVHNGDLPPVVTSSVQVIDIIDEMGTSVASSAIESSGCDHDLTLRGTIEDTAIHEEDKAQHEVIKPKDKDVVEGTQEDSRPMDGCKPQDAVEDKPCGVAGADGLLSSEDNKCLSEQYEEETLVIHEEEDIMSFESDKENGEEYLSDENELKKSVSPSGGHFESNREQPGTEGRPEISRHSYSRYDTVSYRKIRKGNTKQRIDEFESMMNL